ncbi:hypothetical protein BamIOP4010DRAFT_1324 [Burkholderia ambifaria IOP40-10]|uniref:Uncharacterized protein n=1 Tax=Burkholderia ambifaria IOP40-10 TaxID=396596 RepID=B1FBB5_9BURK|nr:hypothetical protein BamIOP4010DRAFT_1324 [Burkholderia ambifaria IOP40-10]
MTRGRLERAAVRLLQVTHLHTLDGDHGVDLTDRRLCVGRYSALEIAA